MSLMTAIVIAVIVAVVVWIGLFRYILAHKDEPAKKARAAVVAAIIIIGIDFPLFLFAFLTY